MLSLHKLQILVLPPQRATALPVPPPTHFLLLLLIPTPKEELRDKVAGLQPLPEPSPSGNTEHQQRLCKETLCPCSVWFLITPSGKVYTPHASQEDS